MSLELDPIVVVLYTGSILRVVLPLVSLELDPIVVVLYTGSILRVVLPLVSLELDPVVRGVMILLTKTTF